MAILDWLKEIQLSPFLREKLVDSESKVSALELKIVKLESKMVELEDEVTSLKSKLSQSEVQRGALEKQIAKVKTNNLLGINTF